MKFTIPKKNQDDVMTSFWIMMKECESNADNTNDALGKKWVEGWFKQWNDLTGQSHEPSWVIRNNVQ